jgi:hypothetical protein
MGICGKLSTGMGVWAEKVSGKNIAPTGLSKKDSKIRLVWNCGCLKPG